ncbi:hypothetical protein DQ384_38035 [Sphaerisporangium album]|uniref:Uncharacterized protein n=1 Tax=Sphaerisporangium album TaxID=509200 RepID=A0A367EM89_9ACTN|nr:hypothetical protein [Sphaerisporangium album]RCG19083.1 hypothetical protein DQ384_38035 [Sphaerisporangium album]
MTLPCPVPGCDRSMPGHRRVCAACAARTVRDLDDVLSLALHLEISRTRQARLGEPGAGHSGERAIPWDQRAREAAYVLRSALLGWYRVLSEGAPRVAGPVCILCEHPSCEWADLGRPPADTLPGLARWLIRHRVRLLRHPAAPEAVDELRAAVNLARRAIDRPPAAWYAGPCGAGDCTADLYTRHGAARITCRACGADHDSQARQAWLMDQAADHLGTATEIARALHGWHPELTPSVVRGYAHRRRIQARGRDQAGRPLYRVGDVMDLLTGETALHGPACSVCVHATCKEIRGDIT